jgi:hypothetical protein
LAASGGKKGDCPDRRDERNDCRDEEGKVVSVVIGEL